MSNIFFFSFVFSLVSCAHVHGVPHAEALPSEPETRVPSVRWLQEPPRLGTVCRNAAQVTKLKAAAAVGSVQRGCPQRWALEPEEHRGAAAWRELRPPALTARVRESSPAHCLWGEPWARAGSHNLFILWSKVKISLLLNPIQSHSIGTSNSRQKDPC